jgi:hypothetical protein
MGSIITYLDFNLCWFRCRIGTHLGLILKLKLMLVVHQFGLGFEDDLGVWIASKSELNRILDWVFGLHPIRTELIMELGARTASNQDWIWYLKLVLDSTNLGLKVILKLGIDIHQFLSDFIIEFDEGLGVCWLAPKSGLNSILDWVFGKCTQ